jgi:hypothetical protein
MSKNKVKTTIENTKECIYKTKVLKIECPCCRDTVYFYSEGLEKNCPTCGMLVKS